MLLGQELGVGGVKFQQFLHIFQLCLRPLDVLVDTFQCF